MSGAVGGAVGARRAASTLLLALSAGAGCRTYTEVPPQAPQALGAGRQVRVRLTDAGSEAVASAIGPRGRTLEGRLVAADDSTLTVSPNAVVREGGDAERWPGDPVTVRRGGVAGVETVRTSTRRSLLLAGGVLAGMLLVRQAIGGGDAVHATGGGEGGAGAH